MKEIILCMAVLFSSLCSYAQDSSIFALPVQMDEFVVSAQRSGWDVQGFIRRIQQDTTFYKAFRSLRVVSYSAGNSIRILDKKGAVKASLQSRTRQTAAGGCRSMQTLSEETTGDFYTRKGNYNYYTAELYAYLFFTKGKVCGDNDLVGSGALERGSGAMEKAKWQLKQLIFNPGSKVHGIPLMGSKASIFDPSVARKYDFRLSSEAYQGTDCWKFSAKPRPGEEGDVVYKELSTWFRKSDYSILARDYALSYTTVFYSFDVAVQVRLTQVGARLLPSFISYNGQWRIPTKGREKATFTASFSY